MIRVLGNVLAVVALTAAFTPRSSAHDIYSGVHGKDGTLCCGGSDCARVKYRVAANGAEFFVRDKEWVFIPDERITYLPVPGDVAGDAHFCGRPATASDRASPVMAKNVFGNWYLYCAFVPPGYV